jgi:serine/threonine protein kinase
MRVLPLGLSLGGPGLRCFLTKATARLSPDTNILSCCMHPVLQVRLVCEYCDKGSLREALDLGAFTKADGGINYPAVLDTAIEIATAVAHLHHKNVLHSDLKARNIMLKSTGGGGRGVTAKVGFSCWCGAPGLCCWPWCGGGPDGNESEWPPSNTKHKTSITSRICPGRDRAVVVPWCGGGPPL